MRFPRRLRTVDSTLYINVWHLSIQHSNTELTRIYEREGQRYFRSFDELGDLLEARNTADYFEIEQTIAYIDSALWERTGRASSIQPQDITTLFPFCRGTDLTYRVTETLARKMYENKQFGTDGLYIFDSVDSPEKQHFLDTQHEMRAGEEEKRRQREEDRANEVIDSSGRKFVLNRHGNWMGGA